MDLDLKRSLEDAAVGIASRGQKLPDGRYLPPYLWERLRQRLQAYYRAATGEPDATLVLEDRRAPQPAAQPVTVTTLERARQIVKENTKLPPDAVSSGLLDNCEAMKCALAALTASPVHEPGEEEVERVADELLAHGEFSSIPGNNRPNAIIAARAALATLRAGGRS